MTDTNVISYFLIIMSGFGTVWSFRFFMGRSNKKITEFEYAGFSTLWGSLVFLFYIWLLKDRIDSMIPTLSAFPFVATPSLFILGLLVGSLGAGIVTGLCKLVGYGRQEIDKKSS